LQEKGVRVGEEHNTHRNPELLMEVSDPPRNWHLDGADDEMYGEL